MLLSSPEDPKQWIAPPFKEGQRGYLREDLESLREYLEQTTSAAGLAEGLVQAGIRRVMEVGIDGGREYYAIKNLIALQTKSGAPLFNPRDLWAIDPVLMQEDYLHYLDVLRGFVDRFSRGRIKVEVMAEQIEKGDIPPFDLVFAKGVVTIGNLFDGSQPIEEWRKEGSNIIRAMQACLTPNNPNAMLLISTKYMGSLLPYCRQDFDNLGLEVVHFEPTNGEQADVLLNLFQQIGIFPTDPDQPFFRSVICKRK